MDLAYLYVYENDILFDRVAVKFKTGNSSSFIQPNVLKTIVTLINDPFIIVNFPLRIVAGSILIFSNRY